MSQTKTFYEYSGYLTADGISRNIYDIFPSRHIRNAFKTYIVNLFGNNSVFDFGDGTIRANQYVGVVNFGGVRFEILPKLLGNQNCSNSELISNLIKMLSYTTNTTFYSANTANLTNVPSDFLEAYISEYCRHLNACLKRRSLARFELKEDNLRFIKGKIQFAENVRVNKFDQSKLYCVFDDRTSDNIINQTLKYVTKLLIKVTKVPQNHSRLKSILTYFTDVSEKEIKYNTVKDLKISRSNKEFETSFNLAKLFLKGHQPTSTYADQEVISICYNMNELFEEFVYQFLLRNAEQIGIHDVKFQSHKHLVTGKRELGTSHDFAKANYFNTYSDITCKVGSTLTIIDTKYKLISSERSVINADIFQIMAYQAIHSDQNSKPKSILLYPKYEQEITSELSFNNANRSFGIATIDIVDCLNSEGNKIKLIERFKKIFISA